MHGTPALAIASRIASPWDASSPAASRGESPCPLGRPPSQISQWRAGGTATTTASISGRCHELEKLRDEPCAGSLRLLATNDRIAPAEKSQAQLGNVLHDVPEVALAVLSGTDEADGNRSRPPVVAGATVRELRSIVKNVHHVRRARSSARRWPLGFRRQAGMTSTIGPSLRPDKPGGRVPAARSTVRKPEPKGAAPWTSKLAGKGVIVTGASRGIGRSIALAFAAEKANLAICARGDEGVAQGRGGAPREGRGVHAAACDVGDEKQLAAFLDGAAQALGRIDVLVNNPSAFALADDESGGSRASTST